MLKHILFTKKMKTRAWRTERDLLLQIGNTKTRPSWQTPPFKRKTRTGIQILYLAYYKIYMLA